MVSRKGGTLFGHSSDCYNWDNQCHCGSDQPLLLPPEVDTPTTQLRRSNIHYDTEGLYTDNYKVPNSLPHRGEPAAASNRYCEVGRHVLQGREPSFLGHTSQCFHVDNRCHCSSSHRGEPAGTIREHYEVRRPTSQGREPPLLGHTPQCFHMDNKCHCSSSQPYLLPPEGSYSLAPQHLYGASNSAKDAAINTNNSSLHQISPPVSQSEDSLASGAGPSQGSRVHDHHHHVTYRTTPVQFLGQYNNGLRTQFGNPLSIPEYNPSDDLPPSYSELFPDK